MTSRQISMAWGEQSHVGPPEPPARLGGISASFANDPAKYRKGRCRLEVPRWRSVDASARLRHIGSKGPPLLKAFVATARALLPGRSRWRCTRIAIAARELRSHWQQRVEAAPSNRAIGWLDLLYTRWPVCEALSLLETAQSSTVRNDNGVCITNRLASDSIEFESTLVRALEARIETASIDTELHSLAAVQGAVLPSEAFLLHTLADLVGASI